MNGNKKLEDYIRENRTSFDNLKAPDHIWSAVRKKNRPVHHLWKWSAVAASGLLLIAVGYIWGMQTHAKPDIVGWEAYLEAELYYQNRINMKLEEIRSLPVSHEILEDIRAQDDVYQQLRKELFDNPNADTEMILSAMTRHLQQQLKVMERILSRADKSKSNENENHEM